MVYRAIDSLSKPKVSLREAQTPARMSAISSWGADALAMISDTGDVDAANASESMEEEVYEEEKALV